MSTITQTPAKTSTNALPALQLEVRDATEADLPAIQAIYAHHVLHGVASFEETPPSIDDLRGRLASVLSHGLPYMVAEIDGAIAGYCYATPYRPRAAYRNTIEDSIYIDDAFRGRGIGRVLLKALIERCETGPWRQMVAVIAASQPRLRDGRYAKSGRIQTRALARYHADAACAGCGG
ncbi:L-amino acid N-acyltransferase YncA [Paraburkholderia sp. GAS33]|jgi:phosphinothricin acetyltransferase